MSSYSHVEYKVIEQLFITESSSETCENYSQLLKNCYCDNEKLLSRARMDCTVVVKAYSNVELFTC